MRTMNITTVFAVAFVLCLFGIATSSDVSFSAYTTVESDGSDHVSTFEYTGSDQTYSVPTGTTSLKVRLWGAGGGGGSQSKSG